MTDKEKVSVLIEALRDFVIWSEESELEDDDAPTMRARARETLETVEGPIELVTYRGILGE